MAPWCRWPNRTARAGTPGRSPKERRCCRRPSATVRRGRIRSKPRSRRCTTRHPSDDETDWLQILALYRVLERLAPGPVVTLNRAVAVARVDGPRAGLALLTPLADDPQLARGHRLDAVRGHLLELAGDRDAARAAYRQAARTTASRAERDYLTLRAARLEDPT